MKQIAWTQFIVLLQSTNQNFYHNSYNVTTCQIYISCRCDKIPQFKVMINILIQMREKRIKLLKLDKLSLYAKDILNK